MDYNLERQRETPIAYDVTYRGVNYGDMPGSLLTSKFEETDMGDEEDMHDNYVRKQATNWGPDTNQFEHEASRGGVTQRSGRLNLQYYGHRGTAYAEKPELFLGFGGPEDHDPRGVATDPDFKKLVGQHNARMRFQRFDKDMSDHIGSGNRSEAKVMLDQQTSFKITRDRLKGFDRSIDGRREGLRRLYSNKSDVTKQVFVQSYGEYIKDYALNPQRSANVIVGQLIRDSREWRDFTADQDFAVAKYLSITRKSQQKWANKAKTTEVDSRFADADPSKCYKTAGILMSQIVRAKRQKQDNVSNSDVEFGTTQETKVGKNVPVVKDLTAVVRHIVDNTLFGASQITQMGKNVTPQQREHLAREIVYNHVAPSHHYLKDRKSVV